MKFLAVAVLAIIVVACGGGGGNHGGGSVLPTAQNTPAKAKGKFALKLSLPKPPANASARLRRRYALSSSTNSVMISAYTSPKSSNPTAVYTQAFDVSSGSANCTTNADGSRTCNLYAALNPGTYDVQVATYGVVATGATPPPASPLAYGFLAAQTISSGGQTSLSMTVAGIVSAMSVTLPVPTVNEIDRLIQYASVSALDASGSVIIGPYVDSNGNAVTVAMTDASGLSYLTFSPSTFSTSQAGGVQVYYWSAPDMAMLESPATMTPTATATSILGTIATGSATLQTTQAVNMITPAPSASPGQLASDGSGNMWVAEPGVGRIGKYSLANPTDVPVAVPSVNPSGANTPVGLLLGPDGNMWLTVNVSGFGGGVEALNPSTGSQVYSNSTPSGLPVGPGIATDGTNIFWTENNGGVSNGDISAEVLTTSPPVAVSSSPLPTVSGPPIPEGMVKGPDGNIWFTDNLGGVDVLRIGGTTAATIFSVGVSAYQMPTVASYPLGICSDGTNLWVMESSANNIAKVVPNGAGAPTITEIPLPAGFTNPQYCAVGPDGQVWFTIDGTAPAIGRYNIAAGTFATYTLVSPSAPSGIAVAPNHTVWVTDPGANLIYQITP